MACNRLDGVLFRKSARLPNVQVPFEFVPKRPNSLLRRTSKPNLNELRPARYVATSWNWYNCSTRPWGKAFAPPIVKKPEIVVVELFGSFSVKYNKQQV